MASLDRALEKAFLAYGSQVEKLALKAFDAQVKPWLERYGLTLAIGMGGWAIWDRDVRVYDPSDGRRDGQGGGSPHFIPKAILKILTTEVPGYPAADLGSFMPEHIQP